MALFITHVFGDADFISPLPMTLRYVDSSLSFCCAAPT